MSEQVRDHYREQGAQTERQRLIEHLLAKDVIRKDALGYWVAMDTHGKECVYLDQLEPKENK
jgi:hypothetical protein